MAYLQLMQYANRYHSSGVQARTDLTRVTDVLVGLKLPWYQRLDEFNTFPATASVLARMAGMQVSPILSFNMLQGERVIRSSLLQTVTSQ